MIENDGSVSFCISLHKNVDPEAVKAILLQLAGGKLDIQISNFKNLKMVLIVCRADQQTYESVFNAKVEWKERTISNLNHGPRQVSDWFECKAPEVPEALKDKIKYVELNRPFYLTD